jgi:elongation factor G
MNDGATPALLSIVITAQTDDARRNLARGLACLMTDDPVLTVSTDEATGDVTVAAAGEQHLEVILERLRREFKVEAAVGRPQIAYKETVTRRAEGEMKYTQRDGSRMAYAHVKVRVDPRPPGSGYSFENEIVAGAIPSQFIEPIDEGIRESLRRGVLAGYPLDDLRVVLYDGTYHDLDSSEAAFRRAAALAFQHAARNANPTLLGPVMRLEVSVPAEFVAWTLADLAARRARLLSREPHAGGETVIAFVELAELFAYANALREGTRGRGSHTIRFERYEPSAPPDGAGDRDALVTAPLKPAPTRKAAGVALPEPDEASRVDASTPHPPSSD